MRFDRLDHRQHSIDENADLIDWMEREGLIVPDHENVQRIKLRIDAAGRVAPYVHPRLSAVDVSNGDGGPLVVEIVRFGRDDEPGPANNDEYR
jgi:hypothetical protein